MPDRPNVQPGDWISIGSGHYRKSAVICREAGPGPGEYDAVYLDNRDRAIVEGVKWDDDHWAFAVEGPNGGYADNYPRLHQFVSKLRRGEHS